MQTIKEYVKDKKVRLNEKVKELGGLHMAIIQVGHVPASDRYVKNKIKDCEEVGIQCDLISLEDTITEAELLSEMDKLNKDTNILGYIVQLPLPEGIDEEKIKLAVDPKKDIDGFHPLSKAVAATPLGIYNYLKDMNFEFKGKNAVVIGRSNIVGRPMAKLLLDESMNVTVVHSKTLKLDLNYYIKNADLIIVATGHRHTLTSEFEFKPTAIIMDVGINVKEDGKLCGDCDKELPVAFQSPVPGGCGLLTRISLVDNLILLKELYNG